MSELTGKKLLIDHSSDKFVKKYQKKKILNPANNLWEGEREKMEEEDRDPLGCEWHTV